MRIAVINEVSTSSRNSELLLSLDGLGLEVINAGMSSPNDSHHLTYIHTGLMAALLLNTGAVDLVVGGCGTGQGFFNSVLQYPGVFCGLVAEPLDAWLFSRINGGNCISLALNKGYGWAGDVNLRFIFEKLFSGECGLGYPQTRSDSQRESRTLLKRISSAAHHPMETILAKLPGEVIAPLGAMTVFLQTICTYGACGSLQSAVLSLRGE